MKHNLPSLDWKVLTELNKQQPELRESLFSYARQARKDLKFTAAVVTGSNGKTTVKELLKCILAETEKTYFASAENHNTKIAIATQILQMSSKTELAIFEVGARKKNDFQIPLSLIQPEVAVLLNIGSSHVGEFGSFENLVNEKLSVLNTETAKHIVCYGDDECIDAYANKVIKRKSEVRKISFGFKVHNQVRILSETEFEIQFLINQKIYSLKNKKQFVKKSLNLAAAIATGLAFDLTVENMIQSLEKFKGVERRFSQLTLGDTTVIDDAFNASPESMKAGLNLVFKIAQNKKILLVLGSMLELGDFSESAHKEIGYYFNTLCSAEHRDTLQVVLIGEEAAKIGTTLDLPLSQVSCYSDVFSYKTRFLSDQNSFDFIYIKGSKSLQLNRLLR